MKSNIIKMCLPAITLLIIFSIISCAPKFGEIVIAKPDEYRHVYEANEKVILKAVAHVFRDKTMGSNVKIDKEKKMVTSDFLIQGEWQTKSSAVVKKLNWKECEVVLSVITEKKTERGWELRRLLEAEQYFSLFDKIDLMIYEEMSKIE
jgi:hypothetical protein